MSIGPPPNGETLQSVLFLAFKLVIIAVIVTRGTSIKITNTVDFHWCNAIIINVFYFVFHQLLSGSEGLVVAVALRAAYVTINSRPASCFGRRRRKAATSGRRNTVFGFLSCSLYGPGGGKEGKNNKTPSVIMSTPARRRLMRDFKR